MKGNPWRKRFEKKVGAGFRGYPVGTLLFYGPDNRRASKVVASVVHAEGEDARELRRWFSEEVDARVNSRIGAEVERFFREHRVRTVATTPGLAGCPHEEGVDYPEGETCPRCPFWKDRDRWAEALEPGKDSRYN
jgi:hypothetical protein